MRRQLGHSAAVASQALASRIKRGLESSVTSQLSMCCMGHGADAMAPVTSDPSTCAYFAIIAVQC